MEDDAFRHDLAQGKTIPTNSALDDEGIADEQVERKRSRQRFADARHGVVRGSPVLHDHQQIDVRIGRRAPVGVGAKETHFLRVKRYRNLIGVSKDGRSSDSHGRLSLACRSLAAWTVSGARAN